MTSSDFSVLNDQDFIALTTVRKSGVGVSTPVWFTLRDDKMYVFTASTSGKVKRIRNNPAVRIVPCDFRGKSSGDDLEAVARFVPAEQWSAIRKLFTKKYGAQFKLFTGMNNLRRNYASLYLEISLVVGGQTVEKEGVTP